ncbi:Pisatin demethylase [Tolypocladium ophioglossoides CBS 100239]|uniref:Pisatin demethylase n=1 Tax=Tolypocladium ophioglossoides (strain CBS 100239) TaxID=1163406 RepID=A0A0L0N4W7_TOLOC|nr:Pisatin demethylase [Tolypocladium ophioglossoides CBS 100239]
MNTTSSILPEEIAFAWRKIELHPWVTALTILVARLVLTRYRAGLSQIPGPFLASFSSLWKLQAVWKRNMHRENVRVHEDYGPIVRIGPNHVSLSDPQSMRVIYGVQNVFRKVGKFQNSAFALVCANSVFIPDCPLQSAFYPLAEAIYRGRFLPTLLTTESNEYHMRLKRGAVKAFSMDTVVGLEPYVDKCIGVLVSRLREVTQNGKTPVNPVAWLQYFAFDVLGEINFSQNLGFLEKGLDVDNIIAAIGGILTYVSIAGSDTTAISLSSVLYYLSKYPETRKKLEEEIERAIREGQASNPITSAVINEAMRIHPATGFILERRVPKGGVTLHSIHLPEDTIVGVNSWVLHRNKKVFGEETHSFRPERWIEGDEEKIKDMKRNLFTFGYGPRSCIGKNISILEMWKVVFELYRHFQINLADDAEWVVNGTWFTTQSNIEIKFKPKY